MATQAAKDKALEHFCELALTKAAEVSGNQDLKYTSDGSMWRFPCPLGNGGHDWNGTDPQAWVTITDGDIKAGCRKCCPKPASGNSPEYDAEVARYTEEVKAAIGWDDESNVEHVSFTGPDIIRRHDYETMDGRFVVQHYKYKAKHGNAATKWGFKVKSADPDRKDSLFNQFRTCYPASFKEQHYPGYSHYYSMLHLYQHRRFFGQDGKLLDAYRAVVCEGEKDAETFNRLMTTGGFGLVATTLPDQKPALLAPHQLDVFRGRDAILVMDNDKAGMESSEKWCAALWGCASTVKVFPFEVLGTKLVEKGAHKGEERGRDLTEWVDAKLAGGMSDVEVAREILDVLTNIQELSEPLMRPKAWQAEMKQRSKTGLPRADSPANCVVAWTRHPELAGKVRFNTCSGEIEVIDPPWGTTIGAHLAALNFAAWLEATDEISLSARTLEDMLALDSVAVAYSPFQHFLAEEWDGEPRIDALFTRYLPLSVEHWCAVALARLTLSDLVRKLRGVMVPQRVLVAIETERDLNVAGALMGQNGIMHRGRLSDRHPERFARHAAMVVQVSMEAVANRQAALASLPHLFASHVWHVPSKRMVSAPLFLAVGPAQGDPRTEGKMDERVYDYALDGDAQLGMLEADVPQMIAEAVARADELDAVKAPSKSVTKTQDDVRSAAKLHHMAHALWLYVLMEVDAVDLYNPKAIAKAQERVDGPLRHVVRDQFIATMRVLLVMEYREVTAMERAFNGFARALGFSTALGLTRRTAAQIEFNIRGRDKALVVGVLMTDERIAKLEEYLFGGNLPPKGGRSKSDDDAGFDGFAKTDEQGKPEKTQETLETQEKFCGFLEALGPIEKRDESAELNQNPMCALAPDSLRKKEKTAKPRWSEDEVAMARVRAILAVPGWCAIDFETYQTNPVWHGADAAAKALRGEKRKAREDAILAARKGGRAATRQACTLQLHHESGDEEFVRLVPSNTDEAAKLVSDNRFKERCRQLQDMFAGRVADLCAHNSQFEVEVLLHHGVAADVECTLLAAKALHLVAVADDKPQPTKFSLAALVEQDLHRTRDKTVRDRDWRLVASLDDEAVEYGLQDARDCLELWQEYRKRLDNAGLLDGYQVMQRAVLPTAATNLAGLMLDANAHAALMRRMKADARALHDDLSRYTYGDIDNHGSSQQVSTWIQEQILGVSIKVPVAPKLVGLVDFLVGLGGLRPVGELKDVPASLIAKRGKGLGLDDAANQAMHAGYIGRGHGYGQLETDVEDADPDELVRAIERDLTGNRVLTLEDDEKWQGYLAAKEHFDLTCKDDAHRLGWLNARLNAKTSIKSWRTTKTGHLAITKGTKMRKAEQLAEAFPVVSQYLVKHAQWTAKTKLLESFGQTLERWKDMHDRCCGQFRVWAAWTGRQSCADPNLQNQPREDEFRALWIAPPGRKLVIADYSQIELRLLAIESGDERLREVYREGRDVHAETATIAYHVDAPDKEQRRRAKAINFGIAYGSGASGLAEHGGFELAEAQMILARVLGAYPGLADYRERMPTEATEQGFIAIKPGRRVRYDAESSPTQAINGPIQGGAASVQMLALRMLYDALTARPDLDSFVAASVHDEFLVEAPADHADEVATILVDCMVRALLEIYPEAEDMSMHRLTAAAACDRWSEKP